MTSSGADIRTTLSVNKLENKSVCLGRNFKSVCQKYGRSMSWNKVHSLNPFIIAIYWNELWSITIPQFRCNLKYQEKTRLSAFKRSLALGLHRGLIKAPWFVGYFH